MKLMELLAVSILNVLRRWICLREHLSLIAIDHKNLESDDLQTLYSELLSIDESTQYLDG